MPLAFVAGSTGYSGRAVVRELLRKGYRVVAHVRPDSPDRDARCAALRAEGAEPDSTPWEAPAMEETLARLQPDVVFALLGTTARRARAAAEAGLPAESYSSVDGALSLLLLGAARASPSRPKFVYLSALGAGGRGAYLSVRGEVEAAVRASGLPFLIARPAMLSGSDRAEPRRAERAATRISDALLDAAALLGARRLRDRLSSLDATTFARGLVAMAAGSGPSPGVVGPEALRAAGTSA